MPLGIGYFYDRVKKKYILIDEHATDAVTRPVVFRSEEVKNLNPVMDRDTIVIHVLKKGFIRVRHWKSDLGWQFWGDAPDSLKILKKYIKKNDVGDYASITFTDFMIGKTVTCSAKYILDKNFIEGFVSHTVD